MADEMMKLLSENHRTLFFYQVILYMGRLLEHKGVDLVVEALKKINGFEVLRMEGFFFPVLFVWFSWGYVSVVWMLFRKKTIFKHFNSEIWHQ